MANTTFFCEHCHKEVHKNDVMCPHCGYFFSKVRCPECHHEGELNDFKHGCPKCGYMPAGSTKKLTFFESIFGQKKPKKPKVAKEKHEAKHNAPRNVEHTQVKNNPSYLFYKVGIVFLTVMIILVINFVDMTI